MLSWGVRQFKMRDNESAGHVMTDFRWGLYCSDRGLRHKAPGLRHIRFMAISEIWRFGGFDDLMLIFNHMENYSSVDDISRLSANPSIGL